MDFLADSFTIFGFEFQNWMPIFTGAVVIYSIWLWKTGQR